MGQRSLISSRNQPHADEKWCNSMNEQMGWIGSVCEMQTRRDEPASLRAATLTQSTRHNSLLFLSAIAPSSIPVQPVTSRTGSPCPGALPVLPATTKETSKEAAVVAQWHVSKPHCNLLFRRSWAADVVSFSLIFSAGKELTSTRSEM